MHPIHEWGDWLDDLSLGKGKSLGPNNFTKEFY